MSKQRIPFITPEMFRELPDQTTEIINRLVTEANNLELSNIELTNAIIALRKAIKNSGPSPTPGSGAQILQFDPNRMGNQQGLCLQNTREGFGIPSGTFTAARADMESQMLNGTLHAGYPPLGIAVPIYYNNSLEAGHGEVWDHGVVYSDKRQYASIEAVDSGYMGWGELCDGARVVEKVS